MDPLSRRRVWNLIEELKRDRIVILTTHSMEESDALGDKIAILGNGMLRAVGVSAGHCRVESVTGGDTMLTCRV